MLIADEVITGFGRLGTWFGVEHFEVQPDILVFAKGIAAGYAPLGGFAVRSTLIKAFLAGSGRFEHNFTYAGPVSYTHLDVYKRQACRLVTNPPPSS